MESESKAKTENWKGPWDKQTQPDLYSIVGTLSEKVNVKIVNENEVKVESESKKWKQSENWKGFWDQQTQPDQCWVVGTLSESENCKLIESEKWKQSRKWKLKRALRQANSAGSMLNL